MMGSNPQTKATEDVMNSMFGKAGGGSNGKTVDNGAGPSGPGNNAPKSDIFMAAEKILADDGNIEFISSKLRMDKNKLRDMVLPILNVLRVRGVQMFAAGDPVRTAKLQAGLDAVNGYADIIEDFVPIIKNVIGNIKEARMPEAKVTEADFADIMFDKTPAQASQVQPQGINPNSIPPPGQAVGQQAQSFSAQANTKAAGPAPLTMKSIYEKQLARYGTQGLTDEMKKDMAKYGIAIPDSATPINPSLPEVTKSSNPTIASFQSAIAGQTSQGSTPSAKMASVVDSALESPDGAAPDVNISNDVSGSEMSRSRRLLKGGTPFDQERPV